MINMQKTYDLAGSRSGAAQRAAQHLLAAGPVDGADRVRRGAGRIAAPAARWRPDGALFLAVAFGFIWGIEKNKDSGVGVALLLGFTFFMGLMLTPLLSRILGFSNGGFLIMTAFGGTAAVFAVLASVATVSKRDFSGMGTWLFAGVVILLLASIANIFLHIPALAIVISVVAIAIFSAYILYDVQQIVNGGETNYIRATLALYLDVYNIFTSLLSLLGIFGGDRD
jgi:FtsH-binding integral membrane protein